jgi:outer membrane protein OmpA-like peptidoglycan-associated protein
LEGKSYDQFGEILAETNVDLYSEDGSKVGGVVTDTSGMFEFLVDRDATYTLIGTKEKCFDGVKDISTDTTAKVIFEDIVLVRSDVVMSVNCKVTEEGSDLVLDGVHMVFKDTKTGQVIDTVTSLKGMVGWPLQNYFLNDKLSYEITLDRKGYFAKSVVYSQRLDHVGVYNIHETLDLSMTKIPVGADLSNFIDVKPIYFDLGKAIIRPDAAHELDKIAKVMNDNPTMVIELGSHTDSRGSDASNLKLSDRRAKASAEYIGARINDANRIYGRGYGETKFKTVDKNIHKQYNYLPEGQLLDVPFISSLPTKEMREVAHQINRRTEFIILRM